MDVTAALAVGVGPVPEPDAQGTRDPEVAAAFMAVMSAALATPAPGPDATAATGSAAPAGGGPASVLGAAPEVSGLATAVDLESEVDADVRPNRTLAEGPVIAADLAGSDAPVDDPPTARPVPAAGGEAVTPEPAEAPADTRNPNPPTPAGAGSAAVAPTSGTRATTPAPGAGGADAPLAPEPVAAPGEPRPADDARPSPTRSLPAGIADAVEGAARPPGAEPASAPPAEVPGARTMERALAAQVVHRIGRLVGREDGTHELTLQLEPAQLGHLELSVRVDAGVVHVAVEAHSNGTSDLLRRALPELREALAEAGLTAGTLDVTDHRGADQPDRRSGDRRDGRSGDLAVPIATRAGSPRADHRSALTSRAAARGGVDVLI